MTRIARIAVTAAAFALTVVLSTIGLAGWAVAVTVDDYPDAGDDR